MQENLNVVVGKFNMKHVTLKILFIYLLYNRACGQFILYKYLQKVKKVNKQKTQRERTRKWVIFQTTYKWVK